MHWCRHSGRCSQARKGDIDLEWNVLAAKRDWQQAKEISNRTREKEWENRANGEFGMIAFFMGNTGEATTLVRGALETATKSDRDRTSGGQGRHDEASARRGIIW